MYLLFTAPDSSTQAEKITLLFDLRNDVFHFHFRVWRDRSWDSISDFPPQQEEQRLHRPGGD